MHCSPITVAITGASGAQYGFRLLQVLIEKQFDVYLMISKAAHMVIALETDYKLNLKPQSIEAFCQQEFGAKPGQVSVFTEQQWTATVASGSGRSQKMVVCPASSGTLSAVASGACNNLIERAADVFLKERRQLIFLHREAPLHEVHLKNMLTLTQMGAVIMPASPGFYHRPQSIAQMIDFMVARILDHLDIEQDLMEQWG